MTGSYSRRAALGSLPSRRHHSFVVFSQRAVRRRQLRFEGRAQVVFGLPLTGPGVAVAVAAY